MAVMGLLGVVNVYMSRNNIPIAIVRMANQTYLKINSDSSSSSNSTAQCIQNRNIYNLSDSKQE